MIQTKENKKAFRLISYCAHKSLYYLNRYILPFPDLTEDCNKIVCDWVQDWFSGKRRKLLLMCRNSFKTSCVSVGDPIFTLLNDPNETILIVGQERSYAISILTQIKEQMEGNEKLIAINASEFKGRSRWKEWEIFIRDRTDWSTKEPSIATAGIDKVKAGPHFGKIILDDAESETNTDSTELLEKLRRNYRYFSPMLRRPTAKRRGGVMIIIGTPYSYEGIYHYIMENPNEARHFEFLFGQGRKVSSVLPKIATKKYIHLPKGPEDTLLLPKVNDRKFLDDEEGKDPIFFSGQYLLSVISGGAQEFKKEWFRYYLENEIPDNVKNYVILDPAISQKSSADYSAITVISQDTLNNIFIRLVLRSRFTPDEIINKFYDLFYAFKPYKMGIETNGFQYLFKWALDKEARLRGRLPIFEIKHYQKSKESRIRSLIKPYKEGRIYHLAANEKKERCHIQQQIIESELLHWSPKKKTSHDDAIDTMSMFFELSSPRHKFRKSWSGSYVPVDSKTCY